MAPKQTKEVEAFYEGYYGSVELAGLRELVAQDCVNNITSMLGNDLGHLVDVGAGEGALLQCLTSKGLVTSASALEVSASGLEKIGNRSNLNLKTLLKFDGYEMPFNHKEFDTAISVHVVEHVEHERIFLAEIGRIAKRAYLEVPLEGGLRGRINREYGHINYYTPLTFLNLLETSGLKVIDYKVFTSSREYEIYNYGFVMGGFRSVVRNGLLKCLGNKLAPHLMTYLLGVVVESA